MARTAEEIQKEIDALKASQPQFRSVVHNAQAGVNYNQQYQDIQRQIQALQGEFQQANYATGTIEGAAQTAMEETQRRAAEDRKLALAGVTEREIKALDAIQGGRESALDAITSGRTDALEAIISGRTDALDEIRAGRTQGLEQFADTDALMKRLEAEVSAEREQEMYEQGRTGIEAGTQAGKRRLQEGYARGDAPGGAMFRMMGDVESAGQGKMSELQRNINIDRFQKLQGITGQSAGIAGQKAGIYGQSSRDLANIFGQSGRSLADIYQGSAGNLASIYQNAAGNEANIYGQTGRTLADILSNTITAVPDYSQVRNLGGFGGGRTTTVSGGSMRSAPKAPRKTWATGNGVWGSKWNMRR